MPRVQQVLNAFGLKPNTQLLHIELPQHEIKKPAANGHGHDYFYPHIGLTFARQHTDLQHVLNTLRTPRIINYRGWLYRCIFDHPHVENTQTTTTLTTTAVCRRYTGEGSRNK